MLTCPRCHTTDALGSVAFSPVKNDMIGNIKVRGGALALSIMLATAMDIRADMANLGTTENP